MKCDGCGRQFPAHEAAQQTRNEPIGEPKAHGQKTRMVLLTLCPECAARRHGTFWFVFWIIVAGGVLAGLMPLLL